MKNNYEKYIREVWDMKERVYVGFRESGYANYIDYLKSEAEKIKGEFGLKKTDLKPTMK